MSIITDTLNRLQAERTGRERQPVASMTLESAETEDSHAHGFSLPRLSARPFRKRFRPSATLIVLGCVVIAAYLWGLPLMADQNKVSPEREKGTMKEVNPVELVPSRSVDAIPEQRKEPFTATTATLGEASEDSSLTEKASATVSDTSGKANPPVVRGAPAREPRSSPDLTSTAVQPPVHNARATSTSQRKTSVSSLLRNATSLQVKLARARDLIKKRRYARAVTVLHPLFVEPPEPWEPWFWLGTAQLGLGQWEKARASLMEGLARDATVPQLWVQRALVSQQQDRFGEAVDFLRQAELLDPKLPEVQLNLAYSLEVQGNRQVAVKHYQTFLALTEGKKSYHATRKKVLNHLVRLRKT